MGNRETFRKLARSLSVAVALMFVVLVASGLMHSDPTGASFHKWSGHVLVMLTWLAVPCAVFVVLFQHFHRSPIAAVGQVGALLFLLCFTLLASFIGYLGPSHAPGQSEETTNRFTILHFYFLPFLIALLLYAWWSFFRKSNG